MQQLFKGLMLVV